MEQNPKMAKSEFLGFCQAWWYINLLSFFLQSNLRSFFRINSCSLKLNSVISKYLTYFSWISPLDTLIKILSNVRPLLCHVHYAKLRTSRASSTVNALRARNAAV